MILLHVRYFRCLANNEIPPVKDRLEMPVATQKTDSGLTIGLIKTLHKQVFNKCKILYNDMFIL